MSNYTTWQSAEVLDEPRPDYFNLKHTEKEDDDLCVFLGYDPWPSVCCPDCERRGSPGRSLVWAEAGFVAGHRVCVWCGSHFELTTEGALEVEQGVSKPGRCTHPSQWLLRRARFYT